MKRPYVVNEFKDIFRFLTNRKVMTAGAILVVPIAIGMAALSTRMSRRN